VIAVWGPEVEEGVDVRVGKGRSGFDYLSRVGKLSRE
jgi:hypothetical protein